MILADTDVLIDYLANVQPTAAQITRYIEADRLQISAITCFELLSGVKPGRRGDAIRSLLSVVTVLPLDRLGAERGAEVRLKLDGTGQPIGMGDSLIAGIALAQGIPLFTQNAKHFERIPNLSLIPVE